MGVKSLDTYKQMTRETFESLVKAIGTHVTLIVVEHALWKTKHKYEETDLIEYSEEGIFLHGLEELDPERAGLVAHDFLLAVITGLGRLVGKKMANKLVNELQIEGERDIE